MITSFHDARVLFPLGYPISELAELCVVRPMHYEYSLPAWSPLQTCRILIVDDPM
jgi:hypothetical protein